MMAETGSSVSLTPRAQIVANRIDAAVFWFAKHWLAVFISYGLAVVALASSAPLLKSGGFGTMSQLVYLPYTLICHQRADRSFHLHGEKMAFCQRDLAIVLAAVGMGFAFALIRRWGRLPNIRFAAVVAFALPMALDGTTQLIGLRESSAELRVLTGMLFSIGVAWFVLPHLEEGFASIRDDIRSRRIPSSTNGAGPR